MLTGKCKEDFVRYIVNTYPNEYKEVLEMVSACLLVGRIEMIFSLIVDFFDSVGVLLEFQVYGYGIEFEIYSRDEDNELTHEYLSECFEARQVAREKAISKANEIYNSKD